MQFPNTESPSLEYSLSPRHKAAVETLDNPVLSGVVDTVRVSAHGSIKLRSLQTRLSCAEQTFVSGWDIYNRVEFSARD